MENSLSRMTRGNRHAKGFSLVELLVVIAVIGLIAAIAIPRISNIIGNTDEIQNRRNAQTIATVASAAQAAGDNAIAAAADLDEAVDIVYNGSATGAGSFHDMSFTMDQVGVDELAAAKDYLTYDGASIQYTPSP